MGDNLKLRKLKLDIIQIMNESLLPIEARRLVLSEILIETNQLAEAVIQKELSEESEEKSDGIH